MDVWLDPLNKGVQTLFGRYRMALKPPPLDFKAVYLGQSVSLSWSEPQNGEKPRHYNVYRNNLKIEETTSLAFSDNNLIFGSVVYAVSAVYEDFEESSFVSIALSIIKYKAPADLMAEQSENNSTQVELQWNEPVYEQTISWGSLVPSYMVGFDNKTPFYYGQRWSADEIGPLHQKTIQAIQFFPISPNTYEIYITQGEHAYKQEIADSLLQSRAMNTISLNTPFVIDGSKSLIVSIFVSQIATDYPAVCDSGPAINNKGNIIAMSTSADDLEWELLNDNEKPGTYDYNFIVAAVVSSENGELPMLNKSRATTKKNTSFINNAKTSVRKASIPNLKNDVSLRSSVPSLFPEITKYRIYKDGLAIIDVAAPITIYRDYITSSEFYYEVSAFYEIVESDKSDKAYVSIEDLFPKSAILLYPTLFEDKLTLQSSELVSRIEVLSSSGTTCLIINKPTETINTESLAPGFYFFRIIDNNKKQKVVKAIKVK